MPRILLLHTSVGMGHHRAAAALAQAFQHIPGTVTVVEDTLQHARTFFRRAYAGLYLGIADHAPSFWSLYYAHTNRVPSSNRLFANMRALSTNVGVHGLPALVARTRPDAIVCTHFLPVEALAPLRGQGLPPVYCVLTDYHAHQFWALDGVDRYFVPTAETREQLTALGVSRSTITVSGIPVSPTLNKPADRLAARQRLGLAPWQPIVTLIGSGMPVERVRAIATELLARRIPATLLVATGRNRALAAQLGDLEQEAGGAMCVLGPQPSLDPLIVASDLVVGKAGGLTVSEVLARGTPLIIPTPVPGQESWNADFVVRAGAALSRDTAPTVAQAVVELLDDSILRGRMAKAARSVGRPAAAQTIASQVLSEIPQPRASRMQRHSMIAATGAR